MTLEYVNHIMWTPGTTYEYSITIQVKSTLGNLGGVILPALFT